MAANAVRTKGTKLEINSTGSTYIQVKGLTDISGIGGGSASVIDTTDFDSQAKEKIMGIPDEGQASASFINLPKDPGQIAMKAARYSQNPTKFRVTLSDGTKFDFSALVLTAGFAASGDDKVGLEATLEITGLVTETAAA